MGIHRRHLLACALTVALANVLAAQANAQTVSYTYDSLGRIKTVAYPNGAVITYSYDAAGNRTQVVQNSGTATMASLGASPASIAPGGSATLTWSTINATSASINNGVGTVTPVAGGSVPVSPAATTTYTLAASGPNGSATAIATVIVAP